MNLKTLFLRYMGKTPDRAERLESYINNFRKMGIKIGKNVDMYGVSIDSLFPFLVEIGNNCIITGGTKILAHDASLSLFTNQYKVGKVTIYDNVFIGMDTVIMPGVKIGPNAIIGANSIITKTVPPNSVVAGAPARHICTLDEFLDKHKPETQSKNTEIIIVDSSKLNSDQEVVNFRKYVKNMVNQ
ncbi:acyltransferase [Methanobacterium sp.]|uniref:acyltransferase n=1 Tax=Methanobacterium sp. TaxID=2164 RepID=UPI003158430B